MLHMTLRVSVQHISAHMNPAYCLGLWLIGDLDAADFFALSAAELGGAMIGTHTLNVTSHEFTPLHSALFPICLCCSTLCSVAGTLNSHMPARQSQQAHCFISLNSAPLHSSIVLNAVPPAALLVPSTPIRLQKNRSKSYMRFTHRSCRQ